MTEQLAEDKTLKVRIFALAKELGMDSKVLIQHCIDAGLDVKYAITQNLTADFTVNTDFAQVEVDEQQVNLTRFSLFFPEKRDFFLEGRGIFDFARGGTGVSNSNSSDLPSKFSFHLSL